MEKFFPYLSSKGPAPNHNDVLAAYRASLALDFQNGSIHPLVLPYHLYGCLLVVIYLCIPHTKSPVIYAARWPVLAAVWAWQWKTLWETTSMSMATAFAAGLVAAFGAVWSFTWLVLERPQWEARRVERRRRDTGRLGEGRQEGSEKGHGGGNIEEIKQGNGKTTGHANGSADLKYREKTSTQTNGQVQKTDVTEYEYYWQSYPSALRPRIDWVCDLLMNFRGPGWNWAIQPLPPLPADIASQLGQEITTRHKSGISSVGLQRYNTRRELARARLPTFIIGYFVLDVLKLVMMKDPYYIIGPNTYALPSHLQGYSPLTLQLYRQTLSAVAIISSLEMTFLLAPIILALVLGPQILGLRGEPLYYPTIWGSFSNITRKGLNGLWGGWWHQTFRFIFASPSNYLIKYNYVSPKSSIAKFLAFVFAFGISGVLHSAGSISQYPPSYPTHAPIFFMLQALGIVLQMSFCSLLSPVIKKLPSGLRKTGNFTFVFLWMFYTGWWLTDDFARGGIWLYEPIPVSLLRGLGFGERGDGWWCWTHLGVGWYRGEKWWQSGIAI
ncbi:hypothetical protein VTL71DRAFT_12224 [Oculimacula yallundae]|uniref:Wax synthase domain-containing protein n=1 Tax=Oculimacula yallundae TaxID=86028 RepID=A0ABR4CSE7_9HELO